jgi:hypothetical protein
VALLFSNRYASLDLQESVVRYLRNGEPFSSLEDLAQSHGEVARALDRLGRARYSLLVDLREARGTVSTLIEQAMLGERQRLLFGFKRVAVLVKSAVSAAEVQRHARQEDLAVRVFVEDEPGALAYLRRSGPTSDRAPSSGFGEPAGEAIPGTKRGR